MMVFYVLGVCAGSSVIYEEGEDMEDSLQELTACTLEALPAGGIRDEVIVLVEDFRQDLSVSPTNQPKQHYC
jgi:hypothetical protein